ncbi:MAG: BAX inhibitor (BI)-1/YccA family protein [Alphaproteobacteria bacterium]|nr:BAX inhibitor (BI)-1/YccA family protein [Alphaproteobacteria bacterium]
MADYDNQVLRGRGAQAIDQGLRSYMLGVYNYMMLGLATTGLVAWAVFRFAFTTDAALGVAKINSVYYVTQLGYTLFAPPIGYLIMFSPLLFSLFLSFRITSFSWRTGAGLFFAFSSVMGLSLSMIFATYVATDIVRIFFVTAIAFGGLSLWGYVTNMDLSPFRSFLIMGVWGIVGASLANFFFIGSTSLDLALSVMTVFVFAGITAYQTQALKSLYFEVSGDGEATQRVQVMGAYVLYVAFINMFLALLRLFGNRN